MTKQEIGSVLDEIDELVLVYTEDFYIPHKLIYGEKKVYPVIHEKIEAIRAEI